MKIHYFSGEPWEETYVREKLAGEEITFHQGPFSTFPDLTDPEAEALCIFMESRIADAELARFPALKLIATRSTGFDHIDLAATAARGITVVNVPFYGENTVAEFAFALLLALSRRIIDADERVREKGMFDQAGLRGFDLLGKTLGIIGTGHIGVHMIRMAQGFGMKIIGFDAYPNNDLSHTLNFSYAPLAEVLATSDILTIHVPYNTDTHHLLNKENIGMIKKGAFLINTARGAVIETAALVEALQNETLAGAGLDVLEEEQKLEERDLDISKANRYLIDHPRVIVTPHVAFDTMEAVMRILDTTIGNIQHFRDGAPTNTVP